MAGFGKAKGEPMKLFMYLINKSHKDLLLLNVAYGVVGVFIFALTIYVSLVMREYFDVYAGFSFAYLPIYVVAIAYFYGVGVLSEVNLKIFRSWDAFLPVLFWTAIIFILVRIVMPQVYNSDSTNESDVFSVLLFFGFMWGHGWAVKKSKKAREATLSDIDATS